MRREEGREVMPEVMVIEVDREVGVGVWIVRVVGEAVVGGTWGRGEEIKVRMEKGM